jgi:Glycerophosphoryl diester phosphodiesterase
MYEAEASSKTKINKKATTINIGGTIKLKVTGTNKKITWKSSKKSIATVSSKGVVKGRKVGTCSIKAFLVDKTYTCKIKVVSKNKKPNQTVVPTPTRPALPVQPKPTLALPTTTSTATPIPTIYNTNVKCVAHRGLQNFAPENSLIAFDLAGQNGFWGAETDVQETSDGELILYHNLDLGDLTNGQGTVASHTLSEILEMTIDSGTKISSYPNTKICKLSEYIQVCRKYNMNCLIELSCITYSGVDKVLQLINEYQMQDKAIIVCTSRNTLTYIRGKNSTIPLGLITWRAVSEDDLTFCESINPSLIGVAQSAGFLNKQFVDSAHAKGVKVYSYIINDYIDYLNCVNWGVDVITTDHILNGSILN